MEAVTTMKPSPLPSISSADLSKVTGGFLGAILGAVGPIMQGVTGIISASKAGKQQAAGGGGGAPAHAPSQGGPAPSGPTGSVSADGLTRITNNVSIS